jgi:hypothetical protein
MYSFVMSEFSVSEYVMVTISSNAYYVKQPVFTQANFAAREGQVRVQSWRAAYPVQTGINRSRHAAEASGIYPGHAD